MNERRAKNIEPLREGTAELREWFKGSEGREGVISEEEFGSEVEREIFCATEEIIPDEGREKGPCTAEGFGAFGGREGEEKTQWTEEGEKALRELVLSQEREFNVESWFAAPELKGTREKKALEISVWWGKLLLDIGHFTKPQRITFGPSSITNFRYQIYPNFTTAPTPIVEPAPNGDFLLCFDPDIFGYVEENGEKVTLVELIRRGKAHTFSSSEYYYYPISKGTKVFLHAGGLEIQIQFVDIHLISSHWFRYIDSSASLLSLSILLHLVLTIIAIYYTLYP